MNREINFRAWDKQDKVFIPFGPLFGLHSMTPKLVDDGLFEIMQFTGLKDKNGKEIYEGDIVKAFYATWDDESPAEFTLHRVKWGGDHSYPAFDLIPVKGDEERISDEVNCFSYVAEGGEIELEVIGNIYENPELLKP